MGLLYSGRRFYIPFKAIFKCRGSSAWLERCPGIQGRQAEVPGSNPGRGFSVIYDQFRVFNNNNKVLINTKYYYES